MDRASFDKHIEIGLLCGEQKTCGKKIRYLTEESATKSAEALNRRPEEKKKHDVEPYPCAFCANWHVGRKMIDSWEYKEDTNE